MEAKALGDGEGGCEPDEAIMTFYCDSSRGADKNILEDVGIDKIFLTTSGRRLCLSFSQARNICHGVF